MKRQLWGEFSATAEDADSLAKQNEVDQEIMDNKRGEHKKLSIFLEFTLIFRVNFF